MDNIKAELKGYLSMIDMYIHHSYHSKYFACYSQKMISKIRAFQMKIFEFINEADFTTAYDIRKSEHYLSQLQRIVKISQDRIFDKCLLPDEYAPKNFHIIRQYGTRKKLIGKEKPPSKGMNRNRADFKTNDTKLSNSISRTKHKVYELIVCNDWDYFVNFKINTNIFDGSDLDGFMKKFLKWINNYTRKTDGEKIKYLLVPELGKSGKIWHIHGVMSGIPLEHLSSFKRGIHPNHLVNSSYLNWEAYERKFGYCSLDYGIRSKEDVANYMTKRVKKLAISKKRGLDERLFFCSKHLERSIEIARGYNLIDDDVVFDYENDFTGTKWLD